MKDLICNSGASLHRPVGSMNFLATEPESRQRELTSGERAPSDKCGRSDGAWSMCGNRENALISKERLFLFSEIRIYPAGPLAIG
uniref:Uncharacterized protein n=1 Tax=Coccidioides posadasii RMSCC 3488 TaxID=454284 RepID=A0A0J6FVH2_COCPO|nr:hypothetical protein CPAG_09429 [Coccidioides posadasii RMSCC 3488]